MRDVCYEVFMTVIVMFILTVVSQLSKCLNFMTLREGYFVIRN